MAHASLAHVLQLIRCDLNPEKTSLRFEGFRT